MANKVIQMKDKYKSTNKEFPFIIGDCFTDDADEHVKKIADKEIEDNVDTVEANPTLAGTEAELTSLQIGDTKYKIGGGKQLYQHNIQILADNTDYLNIFITIVNDSATKIDDITKLGNYLQNNGFIRDQSALPYNRGYLCNGVATQSGKTKQCFVYSIWYGFGAVNIGYSHCSEVTQSAGTITGWFGNNNYSMIDIVTSL